MKSTLQQHVAAHTCSLRSLFLLVVMALTCSVLHVHSYPDGAGKQACPSESPEVCHKAKPQTSPSPYSLLVDVDSYSPGVAVKVTIQANSGNKPFMGFLTGAHRVQGDQTEYLGSFEPTPKVKQQCVKDGNSGATHTNNTEKTSLTLTWKPPVSNEGDLVFTSAVLQNFSVYWVKVAAATTLKPKGYPTNPPSNATTTPKVPATFPKDKGCGKTMSCYGTCKENACSYIAMWHTFDQWLVITLKSVITGGDNSWAALGFGKRAKMAPTSVTECVVNKGQVQAFMSFNPGLSNERITPDPKVGLSNVTGSVKDGIFTCTVYRLMQIPGVNPQKVFNLTKLYYIVMSRGDASDWNIQPHAAADAWVTDRTYNVSKNIDIGAHPPSRTFIQVHGSLMTVAWILSSSIGVLVARFYKPSWPMKTLCGIKVWFAIHRGAMVMALLATVAGFVVIFVHVGGYSQINGATFQRIHPILGIIVTALVVINPIISLFRCAPDHKSRPVFNWVHWFVGTSAYILGAPVSLVPHLTVLPVALFLCLCSGFMLYSRTLPFSPPQNLNGESGGYAVVTVAIGTAMDMVQLPHYVFNVVVSFGAWHVFVHLLLEIVRVCEKNDSSVGKYKDLQSFSQSHDGFQYQFVRQVLFILHVIAAIAACATIMESIIFFDPQNS